MPSKNKSRGNKLETEVVKLFEKYSLLAKRAWGSNGKALGEHEEVDVLLPANKTSERSLKIQCKRKKKLPDWLGFTEHVDAVVVREDRGKKFLLIEFEDFIKRYLV